MMTGQGREDVRFLSLSAGLRYWRCRWVPLCGTSWLKLEPLL